MNVIILDAFDWANRIGSDPSTEPWSDGDASNDRPELYEGVIAHELEHLLMNYSDAGELSWVDEGLADTAAFLNGYRHDRQPPDLPAGVPPGDVADPLGRRPGELRRVVQLLRLPVGAGRRQRRRARAP